MALHMDVLGYVEDEVKVIDGLGAQLDINSRCCSLPRSRRGLRAKTALEGRPHGTRVSRRSRHPENPEPQTQRYTGSLNCMAQELDGSWHFRLVGPVTP